MRTIVDYDPDALERTIRCRVTITLSDDSQALLSDELLSVTVSESLEEQPSAQVELSDETGELDEQYSGDPSMFDPGNAIAIEFSEDGDTWTQLFDGEIRESNTPSDQVSLRGRISAVGHDPNWWEKRITSDVYETMTPEAIVQDLFESWGGLVAPGDFDLPATGRTLERVQVEDVPLMEAARLLLNPVGYAPYWDPVAGKLSTLEIDKTASDATVPARRISSLTPSWQRPEATRVQLDAAEIQDITRVTTGEWHYPSADPSLDELAEGVMIASGSGNDWYSAVQWWNAVDGYHSDYRSGDYLRINFTSNAVGVDGVGYRGPQGVHFVYPDASSIYIKPQSDPWFIWSGVEVHTESWGANEECYIATARIQVEVSGFVPAVQVGQDAEAWWTQVLSDVSLSFEIRGRQEDTGVEQISAQARDDDLISRYGDRPKGYSNPTLLDAATPYTAAEEEAARLLAAIVERQFTADADLLGMDIRLTPGDCATCPHPKLTDVSLVTRGESLRHTWRAGGKSSTVASGPAWVAA